MMPEQTTQQHQGFNKQYSVAIDTFPLPEHPEERGKLPMQALTPVINQMISDDAMSVAIGTWPTPELPEKK